MNNKNEVEKYISIVPNERQKTVQDMKFYAFIHYGVNTFTDSEWGTGKEDEKVFNPTNQNTDQWCRIIKNAGMKGVILTCKHHDGFCLWPTKTTEHSIKNSPYKDGKGDVVKELSQSCKKFGLKFGVYLSPWDRNNENYGTEKYNDIYIEQEKELLSNYGDIFMLWLDGACDAKSDGKPVQKYDFERIWKTAIELQPNICISGCGPDIRWVGNESGVARKSEWNVVPKFKYEAQNLLANCQNDSDYESFQKRCVDIMTEDLGSRKFLSDYDEFMWYPAEVDVSIRKGWFYHESENENGLKSLNELMRIYYGSVGGNSLLLLNIPPDTSGRINEKDEVLLKQLGNELKKFNLLKINQTAVREENADGKYSYFAAFRKSQIDCIKIEEDTDFSQRVESFEIYAYTDEGEKKIYSGTVIGFGKIAIFEKITANKIRIDIIKSRNEPHIKSIEVFKDGCYELK